MLPADILERLTSNTPSRLSDLPKDHGIYALHDHTGRIRYVGITVDETFGFRGRIYSRHASGSEGRSHKFSHAYNTGRMWRAKGDSRPDARLAKSLRTAFIRLHCRATFVAVPDTMLAALPELEVAVQGLAPQGMLDWGSNRFFDPLSEPSELVEDLMAVLRFTPEQRAAVERQAALKF